jgi:hypothetical protein
MAGTRTSVFKLILKGVLYFILGVVVTELLIYFTVPVYDFPVPEPFSGDKIYNPYARMDSTHWKKANFHFHTRAWSGLTSGRHNTNEAFWETYKKLGYDVPCISNYQSISAFNKDSSFYIPVYEHGFGVRKKHQLCIGAEKVLWLDYSLVQNLNNKQHILNLLHDQCEIVAIAHPDWEHGYPLGQMKYLSNYDLIESMDANWRSIPQWDAALSSGHPVYILADDDAHDIADPYQVGRMATFINSGSLNAKELLRNLRDGLAFGAEIFMYNNESFDDKAKDARLVPRLDRVTVRNDTLFVAVSKNALKFRFIGQDGRVKKTVRFTDHAWYRILPEDTYIRTEIIFPTKYRGPGTTFYLNPVFRYNGVKPDNSLRAEFNFARTWIFRLFSIPSLFGLIYIVFRVRRNRKNPT